MRAVVINPGEKPVVVEKDWDYDALSAAVGGDIESFPTHDADVTVYGNEEGKLLRLPVNDVAHEWLHTLLMPFDVIVGPVVVVGFDPDTGDDLDVPQRIIDQLVERTTV